MPDYSFLTKAIPGELIALAVILVVLILAAKAAVRHLKPWQSYLRAKPILTANEKEFFHRLHRALPGYLIFPQVSFSALIDLAPELSGKQRFATRNRYGQKYADFVICHPETLDVIAIIELDDRTHNASADRRRDAITNAAGYTTLRFQSRHKPSVQELAETFSRLAPTKEKGSHA